MGGTNCRAAVVGRDEKIVGQARNPSAAREGQSRVVEQIALTVRQAADDAGISLIQVGAVGIAVPGHIDQRTGVTKWSPNFGESVDGHFQMFLDVPIAGPVSETLGIPAYAGNDANVAALGEFRYGAGRDVNDMVMLTLGTGIGSGVIVDGRLILGATGGAVEFGHHVIVAGSPEQCPCGDYGHLEAFCGTPGIIRRAQRYIESGRPTILPELVDGDRAALTPKIVDDAARQGDQLAIEIFQETGYYLGIGLSNAVCLFNPALVVLGGGIRKATGLMESAERSMHVHSVRSLLLDCRLVEASLGEDAGVMGAAELAWRNVTA
jgi:glucokinase